MKVLTDEQAIGQQFLVENWEKPMRIPAQFEGWANTIDEAVIDGTTYAVRLYHFNYGKQRGMAKGLWLLSDSFRTGLSKCQLGVRLA